MKSLADKLSEIASEYLVARILIHGFGEMLCRIMEVGSVYVELEPVPNPHKPQTERFLVRLELILVVHVSRGELQSCDLDCMDLFRPKRTKLKQSKVDELELADLPRNYD